MTGKGEKVSILFTHLSDLDCDMRCLFRTLYIPLPPLINRAGIDPIRSCTARSLFNESRIIVKSRFKVQNVGSNMEFRIKKVSI